MTRNIKPYEQIKQQLGKSSTAWETLVGHIRFHYMMDEFWDDGKPTSNYRQELKFRYGGKTLVTLYVRNGFFKVNIVLGKVEREKFEKSQTKFSSELIHLYDNTAALHDGKWLFIDIHDEKLTDDIIKLLYIKRKPNRKKDVLAVNGDTMSCGARCDLCLIHEKHNQNGFAGSELFNEMDWMAYNYGNNYREDYSKITCPGNKVGVSGHESGACGHVHPGQCNLGLTAEQVTKVVIPYCGEMRLEWARQKDKEN